MLGSFIAASLRDDLFRRLFKNAGILLLGNVGASLLGLVSLTLTARALGAEGFGILVLISTYVVVVDRLINFQSWQALTKYGAEGLEEGRDADFKSLLKFGFMLDLGTALAGTLIAAAGAWFVGHWQGWHPDTILMATLYSVTILFHIAGVPTAVLRLFDCFKLFSLIDVVSAAIKLVGVTLAFLTGAGLWAFVLIWAVTDILGKLLLLLLALRELRQQGYLQLRQASLHRMTSRFPGLWGFVITTNLNASVRMITREADVLVIGALLTPAAVGLSKIGKQIANILAMVTDPLYQSIYPELAKLRAKGHNLILIKLAIRSAAFAGMVAVIIFGLLTLLANPLLFYIFGPEFVQAENVMLWYALAVVLAVTTFPLSPIILAIGRPQALMWTLVFSTATYFCCLPWLVSIYGLNGAGIAYVIFYIFWVITALLVVIRTLKKEISRSR